MLLSIFCYSIYLSILHFTEDSNIKTLAKVKRGSSMGFVIGFNQCFAMCFSISIFIIFCIKERICKSKHLQFLSGIQAIVFWAVAFIWDFLVYAVMTAMILLVLCAFQEDGFKTIAELNRTAAVYLVFGFSCLPMIYLLSLVFDDPATGYTKAVLILIFLGPTPYAVIQFMQLPQFDLRNIADPIDSVFLYVPIYSFSKSVRMIYDIYLETKLCTLIAEACVSNDKHETLDDCWKKICKEKKQIQIDCCVRQKNYFGYEYGIGQNITSAMTLGIIFLIILFIYESYIIQTLCERLGRRCSPKPPIAPEHLDDDVAAQQEMVHNADENKLITTHEVVLKDLTKYYGNFLAVNGTCLVIDKYECFGLLGVNGAGKTTTFQMMTGDVPITYGNAWIGGYSIITQYRKAQKLIGYCPQFDALIDNMTCRESLIVFGLLRGIKPGNCDKTAVQLAKDFDFFRHIDKQTKQLSGGNKRKLSTAISIIGNPAIVFLDEPTTGMDPTTKQFLWTAICAVRDSGKVVILTSHSMEECEALCTKLAIQVNGIFMCLGSVQHMKNKFAEGYTLIIKLSREIPLKTAADEVIQYINKTFSKAVVKERHQELITFFVPKQKIPLSRMFGILEKYKTTNKKVEDYSLSQSSLEQIFLQFVKFQKERSK